MHGSKWQKQNDGSDLNYRVLCLNDYVTEDEETYGCNRNQDLNKEASQSMLNIFILDF